MTDSPGTTRDMLEASERLRGELMTAIGRLDTYIDELRQATERTRNGHASGTAATE